MTIGEMKRTGTRFRTRCAKLPRGRRRFEVRTRFKKGQDTFDSTVTGRIMQGFPAKRGNRLDIGAKIQKRLDRGDIACLCRHMERCRSKIVSSRIHTRTRVNKRLNDPVNPWIPVGMGQGMKRCGAKPVPGCRIQTGVKASTDIPSRTVEKKSSDRPPPFLDREGVSAI